ncbi:hypothetical protein M3J07_001472 [Ascochyta lentis]
MPATTKMLKEWSVRLRTHTKNAFVFPIFQISKEVLCVPAFQKQLTCSYIRCMLSELLIPKTALLPC